MCIGLTQLSKVAMPGFQGKTSRNKSFSLLQLQIPLQAQKESMEPLLGSCSLMSIWHLLHFHFLPHITPVRAKITQVLLLMQKLQVGEADRIHLSGITCCYPLNFPNPSLSLLGNRTSYAALNSTSSQEP